MSICSLENINKSYDDKVIFKNFSIEIDEGEFICITGGSGSGKSTLLNIIGLLDTINSGKVNLFNFTDLKPNTRKASFLLKNHIGFLFQNYALIDEKTVNYNLDIAKNSSTLTKTKWNQLKKEVLKKMELDIPLNQKIYKLSGGEQQRIAIARIILKDCDLILADEPTGSLDTKNRNLVLEILKDLNRNNKTIIMVSHDPYVVNISNRVINLD